MKLADKVSIITGAGSGQGQEAAVLFAQEGSRVVAADISEDGLKRTEARVRELGGEILPCRTDVSQPDQVRAMVDAAVRAYGGIHVLYNNAGVLHPRDGFLTDLDEEIWDLVLGVNLKGMFLCAKYAIPVMQQTGGAIVNTASVGALVAGGSTAYGASKGGVLALTRNIARQYAPGIRANAICPGPIETPMLDVARSKAGPKSASTGGGGSGPPLGRTAHPMEVARLALFLASEDASYITGAVFPVDGGQTAV